MSLALSVGGVRASIRRFSAKPPSPESRTHRFVAMSCLVSGVVLPFIPPALESSREKKFPSHQGKQYVLPVVRFVVVQCPWLNVSIDTLLSASTRASTVRYYHVVAVFGFHNYYSRCPSSRSTYLGLRLLNNPSITHCG